MKKIYLIVLALFAINACTPRAGGDCDYQKTVGKALVKSIDNNRCVVDFNAMQNVEASCIGDIEVGKKYVAIYEKAMHGSCTPYFLMVYGEDAVKSNPGFFENEI